jgi:hypothetical protein
MKQGKWSLLSVALVLGAWFFAARVEAAPLNDNFAAGEPISGQTGKISGSNIGATREANEPSYYDVGNATVWYKWQPTISRGYTFHTNGSNFDTVLSAWTGTTVSSLTKIAENFDYSGNSSQITFNAVAGTLYYIAVGGEGSSTGDISLSWSIGPSNDNFVAAEPISGQSGSKSGSNVGASREMNEPSYYDVGNATIWYRWTPTISRGYTFHTNGSDFDTVLSVWTGEPVSNLTKVAENFDYGNNTSQVTFNAVAGITYNIAVGGEGGSWGNVELTWSIGPLNDNFAGSQEIKDYSGVVTGSSIGASREANEPSYYDIGNATIWYKWIAPANGGVTFTTYKGSNFDTVLSAWTGSSVSGLTKIAENFDSYADNTSQITFNAVAGTPYYIAVGGEGGSWGTVVLTWGAAINDNYAGVKTISGIIGQEKGTNVGASSEGGEPAHAGITAARSLWFRWVAPNAGTTVFNTQGSDYDTRLAVYTPGTPSVWNGLKEVASNDQDPNDTSGTGASKVQFTAAQGQTYYIVVDGSDLGHFVLNWRMNLPANHLYINDITVTEGNSGTTNATFSIVLSTPNTQTVTVNAIPYNGSATSPADYTSGGIRLSFAPGETSKTFNVPVKGDLLDEINETFYVILSSPVNASIGRARGLGTITDDDAVPSISIDNVSIGEGNSGQRTAVFRLKLSSPSGQVVRVNAASSVGSATAGNDYVALAPTQIAFNTGSLYAYARVLINGDLLTEANETFFVNLSSPQNATIADNQALGTILNDDSPPALLINDVQITEGNSGTKSMTFTVTLSKPSGQTVTVNYASANGTATAGNDYIAKSGTLSFTSGQTSKTVSIVINGDVVIEGNETLFVFLSGAVNASIGRARGIGTINNDDSSG